MARPLLIIVLVACILYGQIFFMPDHLFQSPISDTIRQTSFSNFFVYESLANGEFPVWNAFIFGGRSWPGHSIAQLYYPPHWLFFLTSTSEFVQIWVFLLHSILLGFVGYAFFRELKLSKLTATFGGLALMLAGKLNVHLLREGHLTFIVSAIGTFAALLVLHQIIVRKQHWKWTLLAAIFAMFLFGGHYQLFYYVAWLLVFYAIYIIYALRPQQKFKPLILLCCAFGAAVLLAAIQLLPTITAIDGSVRGGGVGAEFAERGALELFALPSILLPSFPRYMYFIGIGVMMLAIVGMFRGNSTTRFFAWTAAISLWLSLGSKSALYSVLFDYIPGFALFRSPGRFMFLFTFAIIILATYGFETLRKGKSRWIRKFIYVATFIVLLGVLLFPLAKPALLSYGQDKIGNLYEAHQNTITTESHDVAYYQAQAEQILDKLYSDAIFLLAVLACIAFLLFIRNRMHRGIWCILFIIVVLAQPLLYAASFIVPVQHDEVFTTTPTLEFLERQEGHFRMASLFYAGEDPLPQYLTLRHRLEKIGGYSPTRSQRYADYINKINGETDTHISISRLKNIEQPRLLDLLNVRFIVSDKQLEYPVVFADKNYQYYDVEGNLKYHENVYVYENREAFPRAYIVPNAESVTHPLNRITDPSFNPHTKVFLEPDAKISTQNPSGFADATIVKYSQNEIVVRTLTDNTAFLVLSELHDKNWIASIDGHPTKIYRGNSIFRVVEIPAGTHEITFTYQSNAFSAGVIISVIAWIILITYLIARLRRD